MNLSTILHLLRNPWGHEETEIREARLEACNMLEAQLKYINAAEKAFGTFYPNEATGVWDEFKKARAALGLK